MRKAMDMVAEFHRKHGAPVLDRVATPAEMEARRHLRLNLIEEEASELAEALGVLIDGDRRTPDPIAVADALADLAYVTIGAALEWGIPLDRVFAEVHRSNMTKTPGKVRGDGKILKGEGYDPPRIGEVLGGALTKNEREMMEHALGRDYPHKSRDFRNYYVTMDPADIATWRSLVERGLATEQRRSTLHAMVTFNVTDAGKAALDGGSNG